MRKNEIVITYDYYTLEQAREILQADIKREVKRKLARKGREEQIYFLKQKCTGIALIAIATIAFVVSKDMTASLLLWGLGAACFTKKHLIYK